MKGKKQEMTINKIIVWFFIILICQGSYSQDKVTFIINNKSDSIIVFPFRKSNPIIKILNDVSDTLVIIYDNIPDGCTVTSHHDTLSYFNYLAGADPHRVGKYHCILPIFNKNISIIIVPRWEDWYIFKRKKRSIFELKEIVKCHHLPCMSNLNK